MADSGKLSKLNILVAQLESIVAAAAHKLPEPLICFDLLVDLLSTIDQEPKESILRCQRKCEDALQALLILGVRPPVRRLASTAIVRLIEKGDSISIYSRASSLQGWLSDKMDKKSEPASCIGAAQCLGALLQAFGQRITSGLVETSSIVAKLMRYSEVGVRQAALELLQDALEGSGGGGSMSAYTEALRIIMKLGATDKSAVVRAAAAGCLRAFAVTGGPGLGVGGLENCATVCLKALEDSAQAVRDGFAAALGALLALGLNPQAQAQAKGKAPSPPSKTIDGGLQKHLVTPFVKAQGPKYKEIRVGLTMAWVAFLQGMRLIYMHNDLELEEFALQAIGMLALSPDTHAQACVLFCLRVGIVEQMGEPAQKILTDHLIKQLSTPEVNSAMVVVILRTLSHLLATLGEVSVASRETLDNSLVGMLSNSSMAVRVEAALALRTLAQVDATSANNLLSFGLTTLRALCETVSVEKGDRLRLELDSLHGQAAMLAALITACPRLTLGVPSRLPLAVWDLAQSMVRQKNGNPVAVGAEKEAGWMLIASVISSMPKEELEQQKLEILVLWTSEFGGNYEERLKKAESMLAVNLNVWSAAVEALTAFVKSFVLPNLSPTDEGILLQPVIGYLSGALAYLSSSTLQQAPAALRPAISLFTIRTLRAFQALPDPFSYGDDHSALLAICTAPFRDPANFGGSSCLRQLLDSRDASLGPWIPGRDSFEDELRAFEGGAEGLLPCVWVYEIPAFPQPLPVATVLLDEMLLCFGNVFAAQTEKGKLQLLEIILESARAGKKQIWHSANVTNVCVALLGGLKGSIGMRSQGSEVDAMKLVQEILQSILGEEGVSSAERRAAAEGLGVLARLGSDVYAARLTRSLLIDVATSPLLPLKGSTALALGCIHRSVGGMALSALVPATVQALCALAKDPSVFLHIWSLHGLWLTADAAGLSYVPHVQATLSLAMELLLSEEHAAPELGQSIGRLVNGVVAVLGPELSPGSSLFARCKAVVAEIGTGDEPAALLECVLFTQQLALFAPRAVPVHSHVQTLRPTLTSRQPSLRQAAASTLRHLSERDPVAMVEERIEEDLFAMLDNETNESIIQIVRSTLQRLLEAACPSFPSRWLHLCRNVVLATSTTKSAGAGFQDVESPQTEVLSEEIGEDHEGMIADRTSLGQSSMGGKSEAKTKDTDQLPRYKTRVFAAECLCRLPIVVEVDPTHFDLVRVKEIQASSQGHAGDWLVLHLGELVAVAYQVATGTMESVRPLGVELLDIILDKFGETEDPMYEGHLLLEQYQAQLVSAIRTALDPSAGPLLMSAGSRLAARIITSGGAGGDRALLQRIVSLLTQPLLRWDDIVNPNYAEWVGCKVQVSLLGAHAAVKTYAFACSKGSSTNPLDGVIILSLLTPHSKILGRFWIGLLRDYTALRLHATTKSQPKYQPFLEGIQLVTIASMVQQYLSEVWSVVLEAVTLDAYPAASLAEENEDKLSGIELSKEDFKQIWALAVLILTEEKDQATDKRLSVTSFPSFNPKSRAIKPPSTCQLAALNSLRCLCSGGFYSPDMLSVDLCNELVQILSNPFVNQNSTASPAVLSVLDQIVKSCPRGYVESKDMALKVVELCLSSIFQLLTSKEDLFATGSVDDPDEVMSNALQTLGNLVCHLNTEVQDVVLPQLLSAGIKLLTLLPLDGNVATSAVAFITNVTVVATRPKPGSASDEGVDLTQRASVLAAGVESLAQISMKYAEGMAGIDQTELPSEQDSTKRLGLFLGVMVALARSVPGVSSVERGNFKKAAQDRCINSLRWFLSNSNIQVQLTTLQTLRTVAQTGTTEEPLGESHTWSLILLRELGVDVTQIVYNNTQKDLTIASAAAVGESLKLLILLHSLVEGDEAQQNVLHLLLPAIIVAASTKNQGNLQVTTALTAAAVKLVTHLASVSSSAAQFRNVLLELPPESRQQLQEIIKASMSQQHSSAGVSPPAPVQLTVLKPLVPAGSFGIKNFIPPPGSSFQPLKVAHAVPQPAPPDFDDEEDDWDDFQGNSETTSSIMTPDIHKTDHDTASEDMENNFEAYSPVISGGLSGIPSGPESEQDRGKELDDDFQAVPSPPIAVTKPEINEDSSSAQSSLENSSPSVNLNSFRVDGVSSESYDAHHETKDGVELPSTSRSRRRRQTTEEDLKWEENEDGQTPGISSYSIANQSSLESKNLEDPYDICNTPQSSELTSSVSLDNALEQRDEAKEVNGVISVPANEKAFYSLEVDGTNVLGTTIPPSLDRNGNDLDSDVETCVNSDSSAPVADISENHTEIRAQSTELLDHGGDNQCLPSTSNVFLLDNLDREQDLKTSLSSIVMEPGGTAEEVDVIMSGSNGSNIDTARSVQVSSTQHSVEGAMSNDLSTAMSEKDIEGTNGEGASVQDDPVQDLENIQQSATRILED